jgi:chromate reductase, NAD(P)H dehydrogenase (quinone)
MSRDIAVIVGSLRRESINRRCAKALAALAPKSLSLEIVEIGDLPFYNQDLDTDAPPAPWVAFRERVGRADGVIFVTPEYNRSVPGALKNAIDVGSRPFGKGVWQKKPGAVVSVSGGALGGFGANHHLRQSLVHLDVLTLQQPEAYLGHGNKLFDADGNVLVDESREFLTKLMAAYAAWVERVLG